jgi:Nidogen-like
MLKKLTTFVGIAVSLMAADQVQAANLLTGFGGPAGYGELSQGRNDDGSSNRLNLPFNINFFGNNYSNFWVNNNGNLTFGNATVGSALGTFTPNPFGTVNRQPIIAPYWADVDTSCARCGEVYVATPNANTVVATWNNVGFYPSDASKLNTFQVALRNRADTGAGNFDIDFRYDTLQWTTGGASGGVAGLGGTPAQAGFDAGDSRNFLTLPGSRTAQVLNLQNTSNVGTEFPGLYSFAIRNGELPGSTPTNPLLPVVTDRGFRFDLNIGDINRRIFIDPLLAVGYDYAVQSGPNFSSVLLPTGIGDNLYDLFRFDATLNTYVDSGTRITGGVAYDFAAGGVDRFSIRGIETSANLNPNDPTAFVTGLTFTSTGNAVVFQSPVVVNTDSTSTAVPEPFTIVGTLIGATAAFRMRKRLKVTNKL